MIVPFFSKDSIKADSRVADYWHEPARDLDCAMGLDRELMKAHPEIAIYVRHLMPGEFEAEFKGGTHVGGQMTRDQVKSEMVASGDDVRSNGRLVLVVDRKVGCRLKDFVFVFTFPDSNKVDVPDELIGKFNSQLQHMKKLIKQLRK